MNVCLTVWFMVFVKRVYQRKWDFKRSLLEEYGKYSALRWSDLD